jgi:hypothetical protein
VQLFELVAHPQKDVLGPGTVSVQCVLRPLGVAKVGLSSLGFPDQPRFENGDSVIEQIDRMALLAFQFGHLWLKPV